MDVFTAFAPIPAHRALPDNTGIPAMNIELAVIGGTGVYALGELADVETHQPVTAYGAPSGPIRVGTYAGKRVAFLARHGEGHSLPPHKINYRANLAALKAIGASQVLALNTVGGIAAQMRSARVWRARINSSITPGAAFRLCARSRAPTYCMSISAIRTRRVAYSDHRSRAAGFGALGRCGLLWCDPGSAAGNKAEIARMRRDGCDLVGMTGMAGQASPASWAWTTPASPSSPTGRRWGPGSRRVVLQDVRTTCRQRWRRERGRAARLGGLLACGTQAMALHGKRLLHTRRRASGHAEDARSGTFPRGHSHHANTAP